MVSNTQQTQKIRTTRDKRQNRRRKRLAQRFGTPQFPVHPPNYDPTAADAKRVTTGKDEG